MLEIEWKHMVVKIAEVLLSVLIAFIVIGIHELAHIVAGVIQGFRFELFVLGPLGVKRDGNSVKVYLNTNIAFYGGIASTMPRDTNPKNATKLARVLIAGPIASLVLAALLGVLYFISDQYLSRYLLIGALTSLGIFMATTIPSKTGMFFTDRKRFQRLYKDGPAKEAEQALLRILGSYGKDSSYVNVEQKDIEKLIADTDYRYFGLFTKLTYQFEKTGQFDTGTEEEFNAMSQSMPKSTVKAMNMQLDKWKAAS